jgi:hypothetical protein
VLAHLGVVDQHVDHRRDEQAAGHPFGFDDPPSWQDANAGSNLLSEIPAFTGNHNQTWYIGGNGNHDEIDPPVSQLFAFLDHYVKGVDNAWQKTPHIQLWQDDQLPAGGKNVLPEWSVNISKRVAGATPICRRRSPRCSPMARSCTSSAVGCAPRTERSTPRAPPRSCRSTTSSPRTSNRSYPRQPTYVRLQILPFSVAIRPGARLRVIVDTPSPTGVHIFTFLPIPATNTIYHDPSHPSELVSDCCPA